MDSFKDALIWLSSLPMPHKFTISIVVVAAAAFILLTMWVPVGERSSRSRSPPVAQDSPVLIEKVGALNPRNEGFVEWTKHSHVQGVALQNEDETGFDTWQVRSDGQDYYWRRLDPAEKQRAWSQGWKLTVRCKLESGLGFAGVIFGEGYRRFTIAFQQTDGRQRVGLITQVTPEFRFYEQYEVAEGMSAYPEVELVFDPGTESADLYVEGIRRITGYRGFTQYVGEDRGVVFGALRHKGEDGVANFRQVRFQSN